MEMSSNTTRLANLLSLNKLEPARGEFIKTLITKVGSTYSYWRDLLDGKKSFGEKKARGIEEGFGLPIGWLDVDRSRGQPAKPPIAFQDRRQFSDSEWETWQAVKVMIPEEQLADIRRRHANLEDRVRRNLAAAGEAAGNVTTLDTSQSGGMRQITSPWSKNNHPARRATDKKRAGS